MTDRPIATLYLRSAAECATSIVEQRQACEAHAAAHGWRIGETFIDDGASAHLEDRPGIADLRESVREGRTALILVYELSRLFRCVDSSNAFASFCERHGAQIAYVHTPAKMTAKSAG